MLPFRPAVRREAAVACGFLGDGGLMKFPNVVLPGEGPMPYADVGTALEASVVTWADLKWIREAWQGPIVVKGVHIGDDARRAIDAGADAVVVSNHGGRQLDDVHATLRVLPEIVAAAKGQVEVLLDGGIRRGGDVAKALCLGARAVRRSRVRVRSRRRRRSAACARHRDPERGLVAHDQAAGVPVDVERSIDRTSRCRRAGSREGSAHGRWR